jgi:hypothetical protein
MPGMSTATQDSNYNGAQKTQEAAEQTKKLSRKQKKAAAKAAPASGATQTVASQAHNTATVNLGTETPIPSAAEMGDQADKVAQEATEKVKAKSGLMQTVQNDINYTKDFASELGGILSGKNMENAKLLGQEADTLGDLGKAGGNYLEKVGGGSKAIGGAKVGAYMLGTAMLVDMLNPFSD